MTLTSTLKTLEDVGLVVSNLFKTIFKVSDALGIPVIRMKLYLHPTPCSCNDVCHYTDRLSAALQGSYRSADSEALQCFRFSASPWIRWRGQTRRDARTVTFDLHYNATLRR